MVLTVVKILMGLTSLVGLMDACSRTVISCSLAGKDHNCCMDPYARNAQNAIKLLRINLRKELFGQDLAARTVFGAIAGHLEDQDSSKSLVMSLHGGVGTGKTLFSQLLMKSLYSEGTDSPFVKFYMATHHFPDHNRVTEYQVQLRDEVLKTVDKCPQALFIIDEVEKLPPGVLDLLTPFIQHPGATFEGSNLKRAIFIFLSNLGAKEINKVTYDAWKSQDKPRDKLTLAEFEDIVSYEAFNAKGAGLYKSRIMDKILVDFFVPFLPLERKHVHECSRRVAQRLHKFVNVTQIGNELSYWPDDDQLYADTGCKKIEARVKAYLKRRDFKHEL